MKYRTTHKAITEGYVRRIKVGYCRLQFLLNYEEPVAYTAGVYGWNADVYQIDNSTVIVTGYNPFGNIIPTYDMCREYDRKAEAVLASALSYSEKKAALNEMIREFVKEV